MKQIKMAIPGPSGDRGCDIDETKGIPGTSRNNPVNSPMNCGLAECHRASIEYIFDPAGE